MEKRKDKKRKKELLKKREKCLQLIKNCNELVSKILNVLDQTEDENQKNELTNLADELVYNVLRDSLHILRKVEDELGTLK